MDIRENIKLIDGADMPEKSNTKLVAEALKEAIPTMERYHSINSEQGEWAEKWLGHDGIKPPLHPAICVWKETNEYDGNGGVWELGCSPGVTYTNEDGEGPYDGNLKYCYNCGRQIEEINLKEEVED